MIFIKYLEENCESTAGVLKHFDSTVYTSDTTSNHSTVYTSDTTSNHSTVYTSEIEYLIQYFKSSIQVK